MPLIFDSVDRLASAMTFHRDRHAVLAGNVANVDTPGYQPLDLARADAPRAPLPLERTDAAHLAAPELAGTPGVFEDPGTSVGPDGNAVSLERELAKIDANRVRYGVSAELVSRRLGLLRYAATDGG
jgi:flagellar basal-body rod protein FlgB